MSDTMPSKSAKPPQPPATKFKDLASRGDILLLAVSSPTFKIKVASERLTDASLVFKRMLGVWFAEGQVKRTPEKPQSFTLPDDDGQAVSDMCHLIYHKVNKLVEASLGAERLYHLAVIRALMQKHLDGLSKHKWEKSALRVGAAWLFGDIKLFDITTNHLIVHFNEPLSALRKLPGGGLLPINGLLAMAEKRSKAQRKISTDLPTLGSGGGDCGCCFDEGDDRGELIETFDLANWPPSFEPGRMSVSRMLERLKSVKYSIGEGIRDCSSDGLDRGTLWDVAEEVEKIWKGLCLSCVREDCVEALQQNCDHAKKE